MWGEGGGYPWTCSHQLQPGSPRGGARNSPREGTMGAESVWITSTNMASDASSRTSSGVPWKHGSAGSSPERGWVGVDSEATFYEEAGSKPWTHRIHGDFCPKQGSASSSSKTSRGRKGHSAQDTVTHILAQVCSRSNICAVQAPVSSSGKWE